MTYAANTSVPVERSKMELDKLLSKHGATQRMFASDDERGLAIAAFCISSRQIRIGIPMPSAGTLEVKKWPRGYSLWSIAKKNEWTSREVAKVERERWRCLVLLVKAKLELIALGMTTIEREFLADIRLPNGETVYDKIETKLAMAYANNSMPNFLLESGK